MQFFDYVTAAVKLKPDFEKSCRLVEATYTCEAKYASMLTEAEKTRVLGGFDNFTIRNSDYAVKIQFKEHSVTFNSGREYSFSEAEWAIVQNNNIDDPIRNFVFYEDDFDLIMVHITGEARLAIDMFRRPVTMDNRVKMFLKDWDVMRSWPCYNIDKIGASMMCYLKPGTSSVKDGEVRLFKTNGRLLYALIMPWTKRKKLFIPLSRYNHPADDGEMWTEYYLYNKDDAMFRAVYMFWNTQIVDINTAVWSWHAYDISEKEYELVIQMLNHIYDREHVDLPINASPRVGADTNRWSDYNRISPRAMTALVNHRTEAMAELVNDFVFTEHSRLINNREQIVRIRLNRMMNNTEQLELFPEEEKS